MTTVSENIEEKGHREITPFWVPGHIRKKQQKTKTKTREIGARSRIREESTSQKLKAL